MPNEEPAHLSARRQLIEKLRATADELEAQLAAEEGTDLQAETRAQHVRAWMRQINRGGRLLVVLVALWMLRKPLEAAVIAAAGIVVWGVSTTPWATEQPAARPPGRPPPATTSPVPTTPPSPSPTDEAEPTPEPAQPTPEPALEPPEAAMPEPTTTPSGGPPGREPPGPPEGRPPGTRPPEEPPGRPPDRPTVQPPGRDCLLPVHADLGPAGEVDVCLLDL